MTLRNKVRKHAAFFKNPSHFTIENLLFPFIWLQKPDHDDPNYKIKLELNVKRRADILKDVCRFVLDTKRFYGDMKL